MTVKELIELLQKLDQDKIIDVECRQCGLGNNNIQIDDESKDYHGYILIGTFDWKKA